MLRFGHRIAVAIASAARWLAHSINDDPEGLEKISEAEWAVEHVRLDVKTTWTR